MPLSLSEACIAAIATISRCVAIAVIVIIALVTVTTLVLGTMGVIDYFNTRSRELEAVRIALALDADQIQASYDQGVLSLEIPVSEQAKPRRIEISRAGGGPQTIEGSATRVD